MFCFRKHLTYLELLYNYRLTKNHNSKIEEMSSDNAWYTSDKYVWHSNVLWKLSTEEIELFLKY
jgi:hypothetical protein